MFGGKVMDFHWPLISSRRLKKGSHSTQLSAHVTSESQLKEAKGDYTEYMPQECLYPRNTSPKFQQVMHGRLHSSRDLAIEVFQEDVLMLVPVDSVCRVDPRQSIELFDHPFQR